MPRKVVIDVDVGFDDAWAIIMMLQAEQVLKNVEVLGITCVNGNTSVENVIQNTVRVLRMLGRTDVKVFKGAHRGGILQKYQRPDVPYHGSDGLCDVFTDKLESVQIEDKHAVTALIDFVNEYPNEVSIMCLGPLTNIALAVNMCPNFVKNVKDIYIMGGNFRGVGNITPCAEFNFAADAESAYIVLNSFVDKPITIVPWEACIPPNQSVSSEWRDNVLGKLDSPIAEFMNKIENNRPLRWNNEWMACDQQCAAVFLCGERIVKRSKSYSATVAISDDITRGMMVLDHLDYKREKKHNVLVIEKLDDEKFKTLMLWATLPSSVSHIAAIIKV